MNKTYLERTLSRERYQRLLQHLESETTYTSHFLSTSFFLIKSFILLLKNKIQGQGSNSTFKLSYLNICRSSLNFIPVFPQKKRFPYKIIKNEKLVKIENNLGISFFLPVDIAVSILLSKPFLRSYSSLCDQNSLGPLSHPFVLNLSNLNKPEVKYQNSLVPLYHQFVFYLSNLNRTVVIYQNSLGPLSHPFVLYLSNLNRTVVI